MVVRSFRKVDPEKLKAYIAEHPDAYLREIAEVFNCCKTTITNALRRLKITRKKKTKHYKEQDPVKVAEYNEKIKDVPEDKRIYIDEAGVDSHLCREYARAPRGERVQEEVLGRKFQRTSIVAGKMGREIIAPLLFNGTMNGEFFELWFEHLLPATPSDSVIIMDNASFHRKKRLYEIAEKHGRKLVFLPPYSPELNPIEHFWHWLKLKIRDTFRTCPTLVDAILAALELW